MSDECEPRPNRHPIPKHLAQKLEERFEERRGPDTNAVTAAIYGQAVRDTYDELHPVVRALTEFVEAASLLTQEAYEAIGCDSVSVRSALQEAKAVARQFGVGEADSD